MSNEKQKINSLPKKVGETETPERTDQTQDSGKDDLNFDDLKIIEVREPETFQHIPRYLFEQIKGRNWEVERIYEFGPLFIANPLNRFWALLDAGNICKGILWITIDPIVEIIAVNILSVDRQYQQLNGSLRSKPSGVIRKVADFLHKFQDELKEQGGAELKREILWTTTRPKTCERAGAKRKKVIMEIL